MSDERGATVQGAVRQLRQDPTDARAIRRLVLALTNSCSTEEGQIIAEFD